MKRWPTKPLGEVAECLDGRRIPITAEDRTKGDVPYYGANGQVGWIDKPIFNEPLLLIAEDGGHFDQPEKGVAYLISGPSWVNNHAHVIRSDASKVRLEFLGHYFRYFNFMPFVTGTTRAKLNQKVLMSVPIPVPPLAEQERIVKLLDEADELRKLRSQADRRAAALIPALFHEIFGDQIAKKSGWTKRPLGELTTRITKGESPGWQGFEYTTEGPMFITSENVLWGSLDLTEPKRIPSAFHEKLSRSTVRANDVLLNLVGASIGRCCLVPTDLGEANINQAVAVISSDEQILPDFLVSLLLSQNAQNYFHGGKVEGARANISLGDVRKYETVLPPLSLQKEFAQRVSEIRELEAAQAVSRQRTEHLFQSMLHRAFNQEL